MSVVFDIKEKVRELGIPENVYKKLEKEVREEFPNDEMMFELHLIRVLEKLKQGRIIGKK
jgi:hypothetical protein